MASIPEEKTDDSGDQACLIEAAFRIPGNPQLQLETHDWRDKAAEYLDHAVTRAPRDLRSQVQRVYLQLESGQVNGLYGALVDLFIALREAGQPLRQRLLAASRSVLDDRRYQHLAQCLETGIKPTDVIFPGHSSLLSKGLSGTAQLVMQRDTRKSLPRDPLQEARDHLEYGQLDEAKEVLESAILKEPQRPELHLDLLEIYRSTGAKQAFQSMWKRIDAASNPAADAWRELAELFAAET